MNNIPSTPNIQNIINLKDKISINNNNNILPEINSKRPTLDNINNKENPVQTSENRRYLLFQKNYNNLYNNKLQILIKLYYY